MWDWSSLVERIGKMAEPGMLGAIGAVANWAYVTVTQPGKPVRVLVLFCNIVVSFYVGNVVGEFLDTDSPNRDGMILVCGFFAYPILGFVELHLKRVLGKLLGKFLSSFGE